MFFIALKNVKKMLRDTSIRNKLLLSYLMLIFVPLAILVIVSWLKISHNLKENMYSLALKSIEQSDSYLEYKLAYITGISDVIMLQANIQDVLVRNHDEYVKDFLQQTIDADNLEKYFYSFRNNEDIHMVKLYVPDGLAYSEGNNYFLNMKKASELEWFKKVLNPGEKYHWYPPNYFTEQEDENEPVVCLLRRAIDMSNYNNTVGVLRLEVRENVFRDIIGKTNIVDSGLTFILNSKSELITSFGDETILVEVLKENNIKNMLMEEKQWSNINIKGETYVTTYTGIDKTDWNLITMIPYKEILKTGSDIRDFMLVIMLISAIVAYITAYNIVRLSVNKIKLLGSNMQKVKGGDFNIKIPISNNDEIGQLTQDFNYMVEEMGIMIKERFLTGKKMKNLELKALQAQINPHFLYNSLDMINWTAAINGISEIETMVQSLAKFYKLSLSKGAEVISIKNEIEHVKAYITIQNLRYDNGIGLILDIEDQVYEYSIIKIILQPIIENAILHGILKKKEKKGTITISGRLDENEIILTIVDDGAGMDSQMIESIFNSPNETKSYGISNINERLEIHYDAKYKLSFHSEIGKGTEVIINIPAVKG